MKFFDKIKDLFSYEEEVIETKEIEVEETEEHQLPTFMRNKIEEEEKKEEIKIQREVPVPEETISDREIAKPKNNNNFSFPIEMDEPEIAPPLRYSNQNVLQREKKVSDLYSKKEEPKPKRFKPTPVISPVYGVLDKNYTKDEVKVQDEKVYELQRPSRKIDFESVRNKAFGSLTDDIRNNLCENCELYQEVKITKNADRKKKEELELNLLSDMTEDVSIGTAEENYFDFGFNYESPKADKKMTPSVNTDTTHEDIKIVNHNTEESNAEKIEVKEVPRRTPKEDLFVLNDNREFEKISTDEESVSKVLENLEDIDDENTLDNDIFNLIDSMYDEEEK